MPSVGSTTNRKTLLDSIDEANAILQPLSVCVVVHTHWDREWYHSASRFRQRLVALVDALLASQPDASRPFLLDGQAVVLEDYVTVRPDAANSLRDALLAGGIEAGPWYVLADGLIPSGEALVRNLQAGRRVMSRFGALSPAVAYCPDTFGHAAALPFIAAGFGFPLAIVWRGYGGPRWPAGDTARWRAPNGDDVVLYHLPPDGYEVGSALPADDRSVEKRWRTLHALLHSRSTTSVVLLPNGADHHAAQPDVDVAISSLQRAALAQNATLASRDTISSMQRAALAQNATLASRDTLIQPESLTHRTPGNAPSNSADNADSTRIERETQPDRIVRASLGGFARDLLAAVAALPGKLPELQGELRDSYGYTWTLNGTFGTRAAQKRRNARAERALLRDVEPWLVLAWLHGGSAAHALSAAGVITLAQAPALLDAAWKTLLRAHPHDTLCGCSIDAVAIAMDARLASATSQAHGLRNAALSMALKHNPVVARSRSIASTASLVIRNRTARPRGGVAEVVIDDTLADAPVGPGSALASISGHPISLRTLPHIAGLPAQFGKSTLEYRRRESPQHYPDNDLVRAHRALVWVPAVPALGVAVHLITQGEQALSSYDSTELGDADIDAPTPLATHDNISATTKIGERNARTPLAMHDKSTGAVRVAEHDTPTPTTAVSAKNDNSAKTERRVSTFATPPSEAPLQPVHVVTGYDSVQISNANSEVHISAAGVSVMRGGRTVHNALSLATTIDEGDAYTPSIRGADEPLLLKDFKAIAIGPLRGSVALRWETAGRRAQICVVTTLSLDADANVIRVDIRGTNCRRNQRLRLHFNTQMEANEAAPEVRADAAFGTVLRVPLKVPAHDQRAERVTPTMPMHRWVSVADKTHGATLHSDGLAEVEVLPNGSVALTLVRSVAQLSRNDIPERPGHAGWPAPIPLAQSLGAFRARAGLQLHGRWSLDVQNQIENASDALLLPLTGETWRDLRIDEESNGVGSDWRILEPRNVAGPELHGPGLRWSTVTLAQDHDGIVLRCVNDTAETQIGKWVLPIGEAIEVARCRLDEQPTEAWRASGAEIEISLRPHDVLTLRVRRAR